MPLPRSPACPLSRAQFEANRPNRDRQFFRAARKARRRVAESAAQSGSGRSVGSATPPHASASLLSLNLGERHSETKIKHASAVPHE